MPPETPAIRARDLTKYYGRRRGRGVVGLDLEVRQGEVFGFLGPNGAGKTTTIRLLLDLLRPTRGTAEVLGLDTRRRSQEVRRRVGYLPGDLVFDPGLTGARVLGYLGALSGGTDPAYVAGLVERFDVDTTRRIGELSKGNRQKLGIVQAFMHRPPVLLLDEPTAGLDPLVQREFGHLVRETTAAGRTVFLSSHMLSEVQLLADRVGVIREGAIVAVDDVAALIEGAPRHVDITFARPVDPRAFAALPGVHGLEAEDRRLRFLLSGPMDGVVKAAAGHEVEVFDSHEPALEEVFLDLYGAAGADGASRPPTGGRPHRHRAERARAGAAR
jgi:ABC-2 type transport system ATP-binding protein